MRETKSSSQEEVIQELSDRGTLGSRSFPPCKAQEVDSDVEPAITPKFSGFPETKTQGVFELPFLNTFQ